MSTRRYFLSLAAVGAAATLAACSSGESGASASSGASTAPSGETSGSSAPGAASSASAEAVTYPLTVTDGKGEVTIEAEPKKVVVLDITTMDSLVALGLADRVVGIVSGGDSLPMKLGDSYGSAEVVGSFHEPDIEKVASLEPDLVIVGGRAEDSYEAMAEKFTTILMPGGRETAFTERLTGAADLLGSVFGVTAKATEVVDAYKTKAEQVKAKASGIGKGLILMTSGGKISAYGPGSRFGLIHDDLGVAPAIEDVKAATHGDSVSLEAVNQANPDWLFVVDRDAAIGESGQAAKEVLNTELVTSTTAWTKNQVVYLDGQSWYIVGAGLNNAPIMVDEIKTAIKA
ncbi:siderophore ABC transporter substrate-binding protein [Actinomyces slackii]|uniref:Uncharacterized ABC transporter solute-binding protein yclQ n=1 Tax=Actinomyces slackii TaxID=52774 RepID=A0A448KFR3_9ACTO|nr:siderophore ABC transporter substrate-binding protein [Actinomyces slackii]VEG75755.1 Uncharacterized ABC transporter solute-binding protein yclQ precursor [Actinomyces slackii]